MKILSTKRGMPIAVSAICANVLLYHHVSAATVKRYNTKNSKAFGVNVCITCAK
jgi:hypothetical protein